MNTVERQRRRIVRRWMVINVVQDVCILLGNLGAAVQGFSIALQNSLAFAKYDEARKYRDLTGGDFGEVIGCPGHFTGECQHAQDREGEE